jgi:CheY-like chemotaxis protein
VGGTGKILVVEDEAIASLLLRTMLKSMGFEDVYAESTGRGAVERAEREEPELILMDIRLADDIDGIEAALSIQARRPTSFIFMSGYSDEATIERAAELRPIRILGKPLNLEALKESVLAFFSR